MTPDSLRPQLSSGPSGTSPAEVRLLQERLKIYAAIALGIATAFYAVSHVLARLGEEPPMPAAAHGSLLGMMGVLLGAWLYCRGPDRPPGSLRALDAALLVVLGLLTIAVPTAIPEQILRGMVMLLEVLLILFTRSIFIPSSPRRTFVVSALCALPLAWYAMANESTRMAVWKLMWLLAAITVATAGSAVIYGLRREVRKARQLGQYTLEAKLGEGGMGVVYRARHAMLRRPTAVKLLKPDRVGEGSLRRFEREVQLTASLSHPNTVSVFDFGRTPDGVFYYAMEYLDGLSLEEVVRGDGPQPPARVGHVLRQVLGSLAEAHGIGLVHRDVKPGNVILCDRGGVPDVAKVVDFGLVKDLDGDAGASHDGALVGTPHYLAPEAIRRPAADPRSDLYSAGALAYYLVTGQHVFEGATVVEVCSRHLHEAPIRPSDRLGRPLPAALEEWILACLEKDAARRPQTAAEAAARLEEPGIGAWTPTDARAWWAGKGRALAARRGTPASVSHDALTLSHAPVPARATPTSANPA